MRRLSRLESQSRTRDKLVTVAKAVFLRDGYVAASLDRIAESAGYSKGAVYSNFENKDELCLAVLDQIRAERAARLSEALVGVSSLEDRLVAFRRWAERNVGDRAWTALEVEFGVHAARHAELGLALAARSKALRERIAALVTGVAKDLNAELPLPAADISIVLLSLGIGLGMQRALDPGVGVGVLTDLMRLLAGGGGALAVDRASDNSATVPRAPARSSPRHRRRT